MELNYVQDSFSILGFLCGAWLSLAFINFAIGWKQKQFGNGTWLRLAGVSTKLAILQILPCAAFVAAEHFPDSEAREEVLDEIPPQLLLLMFVSYIYLLSSWRSLRIPKRYGNFQGGVADVEDAEFLCEIAEISQTLRISPPTVQILKTHGPSPAAMAWVGGLAAPSIIATDGILLRLSRRERDSILAHEMAHIANHSLWWYLAAWSACGAVTVALAFQFPVFISLLMGWVIFTGIKNLCSRYFEYDSDRRAAGAVGYTAMITSLEKLHAILPIENDGWKSYLAFSTATHPSLEERLTALWRRAPEGDRPEPTWSISRAVVRHRGAVAASCLWAGAVAFLLATSHLPRFQAGNALLAIGIVLFPTLSLRAAIKRDYIQEVKRFRTKRGFVWWGLVWLIAIFLTTMALALSAGDSGTPNPWTPALGLAMFLEIGIGPWILIRIVRSRRICHPGILASLLEGNFAKCLNVYERRPGKFRNDVGSRYHVALARWQLGQSAEAEQELALLRERFPKYSQSWIAGALMAIEQDEFVTGLMLAEQVQRRLKNDPTPHSLMARCHRFLGHISGVEAQLQSIMSISPRSPLVPLWKTQLALIKGEKGPEVLASLQEAEKVNPGSATVLLLRSEYECRFGSLEQASQARMQFEAILHSAPFVFLGPEYRHLQEIYRIGAAATGSVPHC